MAKDKKKPEPEEDVDEIEDTSDDEPQIEDSEEQPSGKTVILKIDADLPVSSQIKDQMDKVFQKYKYPERIARIEMIDKEGKPVRTQEALKYARGAYMKRHLTLEYRRQINYQDIADKRVRTFVKSHNIGIYTIVTRFNLIQQMKAYYVYPKTSMIAVCFKMTSDDISSVYGYLYADARNVEAPVFKAVCVSPTYRSQDGEYRSRVKRWENVNLIFERYREVFDIIEARVAEKLESRSLSFSADFCYPFRFEGSQRDFEERVNASRIAIKLYMLCWFHDYHLITNSILENHISEAYQAALYSIYDMDVYQTITERLGPAGVEEFVRSIMLATKTGISIPFINTLRVGQKIWPLSLVESIFPENIRFTAWREIYISTLVSNLVLNGVCPSFPFNASWFLIQNSHGAIFENTSMHQKYDNSVTATEITRQLKQADLLNYNERRRERGYINNKFGRLSTAIKNSILYANSEIVLSNISLCLMSEYVGRTFRDLPMLVARGFYDEHNSVIFGDIDVFEGLMFDVMYAFSTMHSRLKIMHGDIHMNNAALHQINKLPAKTREMEPAHHVAYIIDGQVYTHRYVGLRAMLIDFSRSVIGDVERIDHEFGTLLADRFFDEQNTRIKSSIFTFMNDLVSQQSKLDYLLKDHFDLMFKIVSGIDIYVFMNNFLALLTIEETEHVKKIDMHPSVVRFIENIAHASKKHITELLEKALDETITDASDIEWPAKTLIKQIFGHMQLSSSKFASITVLDVFNENTELRWDVDDYDKWGPLLSFDPIIRASKVVDLPDLSYSDFFEMLEYDESEDFEYITRQQDVREHEARGIEPWMLM